MENRLAQYVPNLLSSLGHHSGYTNTFRHYILKLRCYWHTNESRSLLFPSVCFLSVKRQVRDYYLLRWENRRKRRGREGGKEGKEVCQKIDVVTKISL